ncbi:MAG TPA: acetylornithine transaminase, partial [Jiangellaceae bacterium]|nr:acetylornithine transaminase [Jiangellaceae bacterium]
VRDVGHRLRVGVGGLDHPLVSGTRGIGLLLAVELTAPVASRAAAAALRAGFIVNSVAPDALRLAPPLILTAGQAREFVAALPGILDDIRED